VRTVRLSRDMSRRQLADRSGISERYIAQIEAGKGNVSITLPLRIAHAVRD
jgi:transcriptional regulator with XRE-family HTH domain